jgi:hypothetical protein
MPLRAEVRKFYNTAEYRRERKEEIKRQGGPFCKFCGVWHTRVNLAHLNHDPQDRTPGNRVLLCPSCHSKNDTPQRISMTRRTLAARAGQEWLSAELEWAPFPPRTWPDELRQQDLFEEAS